MVGESTRLAAGESALFARIHQSRVSSLLPDVWVHSWVCSVSVGVDLPCGCCYGEFCI